MNATRLKLEIVTRTYKWFQSWWLLEKRSDFQCVHIIIAILNVGFWTLLIVDLLPYSVLKNRYFSTSVINYVTVVMAHMHCLRFDSTLVEIMQSPSRGAMPACKLQSASSLCYLALSTSRWNGRYPDCFVIYSNPRVNSLRAFRWQISCSRLRSRERMPFAQSVLELLL